jgi:hypothetical protein
MKRKANRRDFIKMATLSGAGLRLGSSFMPAYPQRAPGGTAVDRPDTAVLPLPDQKTLPFAPRRAASWWCTLEDILWPEKKVIDRIKRRAEGFARARIDTAINFGFHIRFDFSNYFAQLHGYYANVCEELHRYNIGLWIIIPATTWKDPGVMRNGGRCRRDSGIMCCYSTIRYRLRWLNMRDIISMIFAKLTSAMGAGGMPPITNWMFSAITIQRSWTCIVNTW